MREFVWLQSALTSPIQPASKWSRKLATVLLFFRIQNSRQFAAMIWFTPTMTPRCPPALAEQTQTLRVRLSSWSIHQGQFAGEW